MTHTPNQPTPEQMLTDEQYDARALRGFSELMRFKLASAREKGRGGWQSPEVCAIEWLWDSLREHSLKENLDMVDVANFAMMITYRCAHVPGDYERLAAHVATTRAQLAQRNAALAETEALAREWRLYAEDAGCHDQWRACRRACADELYQALANAQCQDEGQGGA